MFDLKVPTESGGRVELEDVPLAVVKGEAGDGEVVIAEMVETDGRVEATAENQDNTRVFYHARARCLW